MIAYLDNSATTRTRDEVIGAMELVIRENYYNPSALYHGAVAVEKRVAAYRAALASRLKADRVIYTSGGTEADNLALLGAAKRQRRPGVILISAAEHSAVLKQSEPLTALGYTVRIIPLTAEGIIDINAFAEMLAAEQGPALQDISLISAIEVSNETGAIQPLREMAALREQLAPGALFHVDGVQGFLRVPVSPLSFGVDMYSISAHKIHGPKGIGALALSKRARLSAISYGGGQESGLRAGTENVPGIAGLDAAVRIIDGTADAVSGTRARKIRLYRLVREAIPDMEVNGPDPESDRAAPHILNFSPSGVGGEVLVHALEAEGVYVGTGSACSSKTRTLSEGFRSMGVSRERAERAIRLSLSPFTTDDEIERAAEAIVKCHRALYPYRKNVRIK